MPSVGMFGAIDNMRGTPWEPQPGLDSVEIYAKIRVRELREEELREMPRVPEGVERPKGNNRFRIKREDCNGCTRALIGDTARAHTAACRDRFALELMKDGDSRVDRDIDRLIAQQEVVREVVRSEPVQVRGNEEVDMEDRGR